MSRSSKVKIAPQIERSKERLNRVFEQELDVIREGAKTDDRIFNLQTAIYNFKKQIEAI